MYDRPEDPLFVDDVMTPLSESEAAYYLNEAYLKVVGTYPSIDSLALLWAQSALEVGRWKFIHCNNWGNIKKLKDHKYTSYKCSEILEGKNTWFFPYHPQTFFAAWDDALSGATAYLQFVAERTRYAKAWQEIKNGDPVKYCAELKTAGYFTADLVGYTKGVVSLTDEFKKKADKLLSWKPEAVVIPPLLTDVNIESTPKEETEEVLKDPQNQFWKFLSSLLRILKDLW